MSSVSPMTILERVAEEMARAGRRWGPYHSAHEAYGVLAEEVAELLAAIRLNQRAAIVAEAIQIASVAARLVESLEVPACQERSGVSR